MSRQADLIHLLGLENHPEGGYFQRIYASKETSCFWPDRQKRPIQTAITYLLSAGQFSAFHQIRSDELWFLGEANTSVVIYELLEGGLRQTVLSRDNPAYCVPGNTWFAAELIDNTEGFFALCYCTVSPGFDFDDFQLAEAENLVSEFPEQEQLIGRLCSN